MTAEEFISLSICEGDSNVISPRKLTEIIEKMLLVRKGSVIDDKLAFERASNIATALRGLTISESKLFSNSRRNNRQVNEVIRHVGNKWIVYSKDGSKLFGTHDTEKGAKKQLAAIEIQSMPSRSKLAIELIRKIAEEFYSLPTVTTLSDIIKKMRHGDKPSLHWDVMLTPREVWPYREFTRSRDDSRHTPYEWDSMKDDIRRSGWDLQNPLSLLIASDSSSGEALVVDGNHRLKLALECGIERIPVRIVFVKDLNSTERA